MKSSLLLAFLFIFSFSQEIMGQEYYSVVASSGLIVRDQPDRHAERVGKFAAGADVALIEKTDKALHIQDAGTTIKGFWYKVRSPRLEGYVFSGYLCSKTYNPEHMAGCDEDYGTCNTLFSLDGAEVTIYNFQTELREPTKDSVILHEAVFNEIGDQIIRISPKEAGTSIRVYYARYEMLNAWGGEQNEQGIIPKWSGHEAYVELSPQNGTFFRVPLTDYEAVREARAAKMGLERSPDWERSSEGGWFPRYRYQGLIVPYEINAVLLKIELDTPSQRPQSHVVKIVLSYGC